MLMFNNTIIRSALAALAITAGSAFAATPVQVGDLYYQLSTTPYPEEEGVLEANVSTSTGKVVWTPDMYSGDIVIPSHIEVDGQRYAVTGIGNSAFCNQTEVTSIELPGTMRHLDFYSLADTKITELTLPASVESLGMGFISRCQQLKVMTCEAVTPPTLENSAFIGSWQDEITLYVPKESLEFYKGIPEWNKFKEIQIIVDQQVLPESITMSPDTFTGYLNSYFTVSTQVLPLNADDKRVELSSSDPSVATVDSEGKVFLVGEGECDIIATSLVVPEIKGICHVIAEVDRRVYPQDVEVEPADVVLPIGAAFDLHCKVLPEDSFDKRLEYRTTDANIATVDENGHVEIVGNGVCFITVMTAIDHSVGNTISVSALPDEKTVDGILYKLYPREYTAHVIDCKGITPTEVTVPEKFLGGFSDLAYYTVTGIAERAFENRTSLTGIVLPESVDFIGLAAFKGCTALTDFTIPEKVKTIAGAAFQETGLTSIVIPDGVTVIDNQAFMNCQNLKTVEIGSGLVMLYLQPFDGCEAITEIRVKALTPPEFFEAQVPAGITINPFSPTVYQQAELCVPNESIDAYRQAKVWSNFLNIKALSNGIDEINGDDNAPVRYFNLQGIEITRPERGQILIRHQGKKTTKIIVK